MKNVKQDILKTKVYATSAVIIFRIVKTALILPIVMHVLMNIWNFRVRVVNVSAKETQLELCIMKLHRHVTVKTRLLTICTITLARLAVKYSPIV